MNPMMLFLLGGLDMGFSRPPRRSFVAYLFTLLVLIGGTVLVLEYIDRTRVDFGGFWELSEPSEPGCASLIFPNGRATMRVAQDGRDVRIVFNDAARTTMSGHVRRRTLVARQILRTSPHSTSVCGQQVVAQLHLIIRRKAGESRNATGSWHALDCEVCPSQRVVAHLREHPIR